ncbi:hypothetical protein FA13DRAFT_1788451 [Coprinellus micaceus]|jgi:hypothetical protein|uniref:Uncharacterized protein n=1 Tax=Coprinellus micaceus TaxID=71717 RepID=A0A4Y7TKW2_COPMI|nr:hypothetical protein FA13DRAFT_1788451 [Coprinellus micaceus]
MSPQPLPNGRDALSLVGPPVSITGVSLYRRRVALEESLLWSSIVLVVYQCNALELRNPGHFLYYLHNSGELSLSLTIAGKPHLSGPSTKAEGRTKRFNLGKHMRLLVSRTKSLALSFDLIDIAC